MEKSYFLGIKAFPLLEGNLSMTGFSSSSLAQLVLKINGDPSPLKKLKNLSELSERIDFELDRFKDNSGGGPPAFLEYLKNLRKMHDLIKEVATLPEEEKTLGYLHEVDYSSPHFTLKREKFPQVKDFGKAIAKIKEGLDKEIEDFATGDLYNVGEVFCLHVKLLAEFARIDLLQREDEDHVVAVEVSYKKETESQSIKEIPLAPNHYQIEVTHFETYVVYEKTKDAMASITSHFSDGATSFPVLSDDKDIIKRVSKLFELEERILRNEITYKDIGDFNWFAVSARNSKASELWGLARSRLETKLDALGKIINREKLSPGLGERKKSFLFRKKSDSIRSSKA